MKLKRGLWLVGSIVLHVVVVLLMLDAMLSPRGLLAPFTRSPAMQDEHLAYVHVVPASPRSAQPVRPPSVRVVPSAPATIPSVIPPIPATPALAVPVDTGGRPGRTTTGAGAAGGSGLPVLNAPHDDPRIWSTPALPREPAKLTGLAGIEASLDSTVRAKRDSISKLTDPNDWTVGEGKGKFGIDRRWLYLGPLKIPTMLLGLVPLNVQTNPNAYENARTLGAMASEVRERGAIARSSGEEIKAINARMDRERNTRLRAAAAAAAAAGTGGTVPR